MNVPSLYNSPHSGNGNERPWFSILPLGNPIDHSPKLDGEQSAESQTPKPQIKSELFATPSIQERLMLLQPICSSTPQITSLEEKLETVRNSNKDNKRAPIPKGEKQFILL